jgi:membrane protein implicated in regulation of membrane protease activity
MDQLFPYLGQWVWWVAAGVLLLLELLAPGVFFIWLAIAAVVTGVADMALHLSWQAEALLFAAISILSVFAGRALLKRHGGGLTDQPFLNKRTQGFVGQVFTLKEPIRDGRGKLTIDDTVWDVTGPDMPAGARAKVTGTDGLRLMVEAG